MWERSIEQELYHTTTVPDLGRDVSFRVDRVSAHQQRAAYDCAFRSCACLSISLSPTICMPTLESVIVQQHGHIAQRSDHWRIIIGVHPSGRIFIRPSSSDTIARAEEIELWMRCTGEGEATPRSSPFWMRCQDTISVSSHLASCPSSRAAVRLAASHVALGSQMSHHYHQ